MAFQFQTVSILTGKTAPMQVQETVNYAVPVEYNRPPEFPSVLKQASDQNWKAGFYDFPNEGEYARMFNPACVTAWDGKDKLITRQYRHISQGKWINRIWIWDLENNVPLNGQELKFAGQSGGREGDNWEDPRALFARDRLIITGCYFKDKGKAHQFFSPFNRELRSEGVLHPQFGKNGHSALSNTGHEKNWVWFYWENKPFCVYHPAQKHHIFGFNGTEVTTQFRSDNELKWIGWGEPRGGTSPILHDGEYWSFFHSSFPIPYGHRRYVMGAYAFQAHPPFAITKYTTIPLLIGSLEDPSNSDPKPVIFPGGAIIRDGVWHVVFGVNDRKCGWVQIPHDDVLILSENAQPNQPNVEPIQEAEEKSSTFQPVRTY